MRLRKCPCLFLWAHGKIKSPKILSERLWGQTLLPGKGLGYWQDSLGTLTVARLSIPRLARNPVFSALSRLGVALGEATGIQFLTGQKMGSPC